MNIALFLVYYHLPYKYLNHVRPPHTQSIQSCHLQKNEQNSIQIYVQIRMFLWSMDVWGTHCAVCGNQCIGSICLHTDRRLALHHQNFGMYICNTHTSYFHHLKVVMNKHLVEECHIYRRDHRCRLYNQLTAPCNMHTIKRSGLWYTNHCWGELTTFGMVGTISWYAVAGLY